jgi:HAE1 family hydrophobic/amphiphilic exporter-1
MLITFGVLKILDQSLNSLTLFSLVFALGLLIDNAVIIIEGIYENLKSGEYTPFGAAITGIYEFKWPIIAGTLTTVFAFLPILGVSGIMGDYMSVIPITVTAILLASLFVNLSITPTLSAVLLKPGKKRNIFKHIQNWYRKFITNTIHSKFKKTFYLIIMTIVMIVSFSLPITGILKSESFPISDFDFFYVDIETPPGTSLEQTDEFVSKVENILIEIPEIESITTSIGTNAGGQLTQLISVTSTVSNIASLTINLVDPKDREIQSYEVSDIVREKLKNVQGGSITITDLQGGPPSGAPIQAKITGPSLETLEQLAVDIKSKLENIEGTLNIDTSIETGAGEFNITLDKDKLNFYGIAPVQVAALLRNSLEGVTASEIRKDGEKTDIFVEYKFPQFNGSEDEMTIDSLLDITVQSPVAGSIPVRTLATVEFQQNLTNISHLDTERVIYVTSYTQDRTTLEIIQDLESELEKDPLPKGYFISFGGEYESITQSFVELGLALIVGVFLIAMLLVLQFKSFNQPFIIMLSLPFALTGVFFGLTAMGLTISIPSVIGVVGLAGVVVNDAIVLLDQMNQNRKRGMQFEEAIIDGAMSRLQPVFLTTATSIFGILPLALTDEIWGSLGFAFIFGLTTQYFLVLLLDPILYSMLSKKTKFRTPKIFLEKDHYEVQA